MRVWVKVTTRLGDTSISKSLLNCLDLMFELKLDGFFVAL